MSDLGQCCMVRPPRTSTLPPGQRRWTRCRRPAQMLVEIHQRREVLLPDTQIGSGVFAVPICDRCFTEKVP